MTIEEALDIISHRKSDDCAYLYGRECDCREPYQLYLRLQSTDWKLTHKESDTIER